MGKRLCLNLSALIFAAWLAGIPAPTAFAGHLMEGFVVDDAGRKISLEKPFRRIISLYPAHTENLFALDLDKEIIGVSSREQFPQGRAQKPIFSYHDDPEKMLASRPDLVLIRPMIDQGYPALVRRLEASGITVVSLQPRTTADIYAYWQILGTLTGKKPAADGMVARFQEAVSATRALTVSIQPRKKVYFEAIHDKMKTFSPESTAIFALETAGGINVASDARPVRGTNIATYGKERILSHAPEIDVYLAQSGTMNRPSVSMIRDEPGFSAIRAVRENRIHFIDETIVSRPTMRLLEGIKEIGKILYPHVF